MYKRQPENLRARIRAPAAVAMMMSANRKPSKDFTPTEYRLSLIHISEPTRPY